MPTYEYAIAAGWDVPLVSLANVETYMLTEAGREIAPYSVTFDEFPTERTMLDGSTRGDGQPVVEWSFSVLPYTAFKPFIEDFLIVSGVKVKSAKVTIYTRERELDRYQRMNAWLVYPAWGRDFTNRQYAAIDVVLRFNVVEYLAEPPPPEPEPDPEPEEP